VLELVDLRQVDGVDQGEAGEAASGSGHQHKKGKSQTAGDFAMTLRGPEIRFTPACSARRRVGIVVPVRWGNEVQPFDRLKALPLSRK